MGMDLLFLVVAFYFVRRSLKCGDPLTAGTGLVSPGTLVMWISGPHRGGVEGSGDEKFLFFLSPPPPPSRICDEKSQLSISFFHSLNLFSLNEEVEDDGKRFIPSI